MDTKLSDQQLQAIATTLYTVVTDPGVKIRWGARVREEIRQQLQKGVAPTGYRIDWLRETRTALIETLEKQAETFNQKYRHDLISVNDLADALTTTLHQFQIAIQKLEAKQGLD